MTMPRSSLRLATLLTSACALGFFGVPASAQDEGATQPSPRGGIGSFRLPVDPSPSPSPRVQGPVDPEATIRRSPAPAPTPTPRATFAPIPAPRPTAAQPQTQPQTRGQTQGQSQPQAQPRANAQGRQVQPRAPLTPRPEDSLQRRSGVPLPTTQQGEGPPIDPAARADLPTTPATRAAGDGPLIVPPPPEQERRRRIPVSVSDGEGGMALWLFLLGLLALVGGWIGWQAWRNRDRSKAVVSVPEIRKPRPRAGAVAAPEAKSEAGAATAATPPIVPAEAAPGSASEGPLHLQLEASRMSATLVNTSLAYRLTLTNPGDSSLVGIVVGGDMIAAHASQPVETQVASPATALEQRHTVAALEPGESVVLTGEIRLPLAAIRPIQQGKASLFIPLARFSARAADGTGHAATFVVGQVPPSKSDGLQPFRLDLGPRIYRTLGQKPLAAAA